ncbi:MAG: ubiquinone biosynthesis regulatory protein kinase UbiB [Pseudomonadales bacterium]
MRRLRRLLTIITVITRYRLDLLIDRQRLPLMLKWLFTLSPLRLVPAPKMPDAERLRLALEGLGPIFIKFGQALSTRPDLLPPDYARELAKLQDQVPPFCANEFRSIVEAALGQSTDTLFKQFDEEPLASASIAQVHGATLPSGRKVVVKVVRPNIQPTIEVDTRLMAKLAQWIERYVPDGKRLRPVEVVGDYRQTILDELDLQREAGNTSQLRRNFLTSDMLYVPEVYFDYVRSNVMVMERIEGIPVGDVGAIEAQGTDMKLLAERGVEIFFTQVFRDNFFHADMHPGNIFISRREPKNPQYIGIDCAIIGSLSDFDRYYLARNLLAIFERDYRQVAVLHIECGWVPPSTRVQDFESAIRSACEPVFEKPIGEISFGLLLIYLFRTARRFDMEIQPSLVLLQKTLLNIEGLGRELYPQLDLWQTAKPYLDRWIKDRYAPAGMIEQIRNHAPQWLEQLPNVPDLVLESLNHGSRLNELVSAQQQQLEKVRSELENERKRKRLRLTGTLLLIGGLVVAQPQILDNIRQLPPISWALFAVAAALLLRP